MTMNRETRLALADQAEIDARHAREAAEAAQNPSDRAFALSMARSHARRAAQLREAR